MLTTTQVLAFLPFVTVIGIYVAYSDLKYMKIPNKAVLALLASYVVVGLIVLPLKTFGWGLAIGAIVLVIGFVLNAFGAMGGGDAKFGAAMAPFFVTGDIRIILALFAACLLAAFVAHRIARNIPAIRRATPDWISWNHIKFPMGLALSGTLIFYLLAQLRPLF